MSEPIVKARKSPVQARSAETLRSIVEAAARILETDGLEGYTTNAVAKRAGVSVGSLYQYFPGKDALTAALIERETALLLDDIAAIATGRSGEKAALRSLVAACVAHQMRRPALARLLDLEEGRLPIRLMPDAPDAAAEAICAILERLPNRPDPDLQTVAADVVAIIKGMVDGAGERGETDPVKLGVRVERAVFGYLGP